MWRRELATDDLYRTDVVAVVSICCFTASRSSVPVRRMATSAATIGIKRIAAHKGLKFLIGLRLSTAFN